MNLLLSIFAYDIPSRRKVVLSIMFPEKSIFYAFPSSKSDSVIEDYEMAIEEVVKKDSEVEVRDELKMFRVESVTSWVFTRVED